MPHATPASTSATAASSSSSPKTDATNKAIEYVCSTSFHQSLVIPPTDLHDAPLRVTYSTTTDFNDGSSTTVPTILYCSPMAGSRYMVLELDHAARKAGVRVIFVDRPGFGGSTPVPLKHRVDAWIEVVPAVLAKLGVKHVSLVAHSAGVIYLLNTLMRLPQIIGPDRPFAAMLAPWVHPTHSSAGLLGVASKLPQSWVSNTGGLQTFIGDNIIPSMGHSSGVFASLTSVFKNDSSSATEIEKAREISQTYGMSPEVRKEVERLQLLYFREEDRSGISQEAMLCLKKGESPWGVCDDYPTYITRLVEQLQVQQAARTEDSPAKKLRVMALFAQSDLLIGKGGQKYFEDCWRNSVTDGMIEFESVLVPGTNHDTIFLPTNEGIGRVFSRLEEMT
ncbi:hypothetical protein AAFC00_004186 [Neodothiora populina]|uniref:AB hydrolase-1 domain-containing protein n=1 Tax=Neodothiora populina TaxID=2781224 RepID=A0ABR3PIU0_9PEZI